MRQDCGKIRNCLVIIGAICIAFCESTLESSAGTVLKNGVRAGDRSALRLIRPPAHGQKRFAPLHRRQRDAPRPPARQDHAWFWAAMDPRGAPDAARFAEARALVRDRRGASGPIYSEARIARVADRWQALVREAARRHRLSEALMLAMITVESNGEPRARSPKGAMGLMQLIPATARRFGVSDAYDAAQNLTGGAAYLDFLLERFRGDVVLALAGYNAGEGAVARHGGVPPYAETRDYVVRVIDALLAAEALCAAPPEGPRATCAFRRQAPPA